MKLALLSPAVLLPVLGVLAGGAGIFLMMRLFGGKKAPAAPAAGALDMFGSVANNPIAHQLAGSLAARIAQFGDATNHAAFDELLGIVWPASKALMPIINAVLGRLEHGAAHLAGGKAPPQTPAPPAGPGLNIPTDDPAFPFVHGLLDELRKHRQQKSS